MDISNETDILLEGVIPERMSELKATWGDRRDRVRLQDGEGFQLQQSFGTVQVNETAFKSIWLVGFAAWKGLEAYGDAIPPLLAAGQPFDLARLDAIPGQPDLLNAFADAMDDVARLKACRTISEFDWPAGVPVPLAVPEFEDQNQKFAFDFVCMAGAYVVLHEVGHALAAAGLRTADADPVAEEKACDAYAREMMLGRVSEYAGPAGYDEHLVAAKRAVGVLLAQLVIVTITPRRLWSASADHPSVGSRLRHLMSEIGNDAPASFWAASAGLLAIFARHHGLVTAPIEFDSLRELVFLLIGLFVTGDARASDD